jgi:hypothetical protein
VNAGSSSARLFALCIGVLAALAAATRPRRDGEGAAAAARASRASAHELPASLLYARCEPTPQLRPVQAMSESVNEGSSGPNVAEAGTDDDALSTGCKWGGGIG